MVENQPILLFFIIFFIKAPDWLPLQISVFSTECRLKSLIGLLLPRSHAYNFDIGKLSFVTQLFTLQFLIYIVPLFFLREKIATWETFWKLKWATLIMEKLIDFVWRKFFIQLSLSLCWNRSSIHHRSCYCKLCLCLQCSVFIFVFERLTFCFLSGF